MLVACFFLGKGIAKSLLVEKRKDGKTRVASRHGVGLCDCRAAASRASLPSHFVLTEPPLVLQRPASCEDHQEPKRTTRDQKEPPGTNEPWTFRDYPIIAEVLGLEENMSKTQSGVKIQSKSQSQSTKLMMMYLVLAVVILNYFLYPLIITFRENLDRGVFYFSRWTGGGFPPSPWAATSQKGVGDPELVRIFHPVLSHIFGGPELVRLFVANIWTTNQV